MVTSFLCIGDGEIAYDVTGNGPLVLCVPGMGDRRQQYRFLIPQLAAAGYRVASMDVRGQGESSVDWDDYSVAGVGSDIVALIRHLNQGSSALIIGNSMAAGAAVWAAAESPELVQGLVLIGPAVRSSERWHERLLYSLLFAPPWGAALWLAYYNTLYPTCKPADFDAYRSALRANLSQAGRMRALKQMMLSPKTASEECLPSVKAPALIVMGSRDPDFKPPEAEAAWVAQRLNGRVEIIRDAGHYPHAEMPEVTGPLILSFLNQLRVPVSEREEAPCRA